MGLAVTAAVLCLLVRQQQPQLGGLCAAAAGVMLLLAALEQLADVREVFARLTGMAGIEEGYLNTLVKVLGVSYVASWPPRPARTWAREDWRSKWAWWGSCACLPLPRPCC